MADYFLTNPDGADVQRILDKVDRVVSDTDDATFTSATSTQAPTDPADLTRKDYVDAIAGGGSSLIDTPKADFFALAEKRIRDNAGSGFAEWGLSYNLATGYVNEGLWEQISNPNVFRIGADRDIGEGVSRTDSPLININGVNSKISQVAHTTLNFNNILFPPAPDGTKTYDSATGAVVQHVDSATAFAAETADNKVIISRQDYVFIESWHELISDKDAVYPLGNVQYGATDYNGIALGVPAGVAQGYSAFGEWDTATFGNGAVWSTLTDEQKNTFLQDPDNNIYNDNGALVQVRYRIRVIEGLGDDWHQVTTIFPTTNANKRISYDEALLSTVNLQGGSTTSLDYGDISESYMVWNADASGRTIDKHIGQFFGGRTDVLAEAVAHNGLCFAVPIALVQRRNQGAYHPVYNSAGCATLLQNNGNNAITKWYTTEAKIPSSVSDCFSFGDPTMNTVGNIPPFVASTFTGDIAGGATFAGRSDGKYNDAIYASDVEDLRMSSKLLPLTEIREKYKRMAIAGEVRGFEGVPFTYADTKASWNPIVRVTNSYISMDLTRLKNKQSVVGTHLYALLSGTIVEYKITRVTDRGSNTEYDVYLYRTSGLPWNSDDITVPDHWVLAEVQPHSQANPTWTDLIGSVQNIAATFPDGVEGQWIPVIPNGTAITIPFNRKVTTTSATIPYEVTSNLGATWTNNNATVDKVSNSIEPTVPSIQVRLYHYETQAHFTQDDVNSEVLDLGGVWAGNANQIKDNQASSGNLNSTLIGKVATGGSTAPNLSWNELSNVDAIRSASTGMLGLVSGGAYSNRYPKHTDIGKGLGAINATPTVKTLDYLSQSNNVAKLNYAYKEMVYDSGMDNISEFTNIASTDTDIVVTSIGQKFVVTDTSDNSRYTVQGVTIGTYRLRFLAPSGDNWIDDNGVVRLANWNGTGWGDNNQFEILSNQGTLTDDNGNTVLYGTASFNTQFFIVEE